MKTIGIIAEYNPFHKGHKYQIEEIKKRTGAENIVIVMSGNFVQRGTPAWTDKYLRTTMALSCGADLVFELPVCYACASAEAFARGGISLLTALGFVDGICFGAESADLSALHQIAQRLASPDHLFEESIKAFLSAGLSYPAAREHAFREICPEIKQDDPELFRAPNNILAMEYLKAILQLESPLIPFLVQRKGAGYHETAPGTSSTAIRLLSLTEDREQFLQKTTHLLPGEVNALLADNPLRFGITEDDFSDILYYRLLKLSEEDRQILDMSPELYERLLHHRNSFTAFSSFAAQIKTRQYTLSRIRRVLLHLILDLRSSGFFPVPYARLLGFRKGKSSLLRHTTQLPVITKPAKGLRKLPPRQTAALVYEKDLFASNLYAKLQKRKTGEPSIPDNEFLQGPIIL